jgi:hypothetical protein
VPDEKRKHKRRGLVVNVLDVDDLVRGSGSGRNALVWIRGEFF